MGRAGRASRASCEQRGSQMPPGCIALACMRTSGRGRLPPAKPGDSLACPQMARRHSRPPPVHSSIAGARTYSWLRVCTIIPHFMAGWRCRQAQVLSCLPSSRLGDISVVSLALAAHSFVRRCVPVSGVVCVPCGCCCVRPSASVFPCQRAWCQCRACGLSESRGSASAMRRRGRRCAERR